MLPPPAALVEDVAFETEERDASVHERTGVKDVIRLILRTWPYARPDLGKLIAFGALLLVFVPPFLFLSMQFFAVFVDVLGYDKPLPHMTATLLRVPEYAGLAELTRDQRIEILYRASVAGYVMTVVALPFIGLGALFMFWFMQRVTHRFRTDLYSKFHDLSLSFHGDQRIGDAIYRLFMDSSTIWFVLRALVIVPARVIVVLVVLLTVMLIIHPGLTLLFVLLLPLQILVGHYAARPIRTAFRRAREANSRVMTRIEESLTGLKAARMFGRELDERRAYERASWTAFRETLRARMFLTGYRVLNFALVGIALVLVGYFGAFVVRENAPTNSIVAFAGHATFGVALYIIFRSIYRIATRQIHNVLIQWGLLQDTAIALDRVFEMLDATPAIADAPGAVPVPGTPGTEAGARPRLEIVVDHAGLTYDGVTPVLSDVTFTARPGSVTALVGTTGAGKTSLVNLIPRFYDPTSGRVTINGTDLRGVTVRSLRDQISIALQENILFSATVAENIAYGRPDAPRAAVTEAARIACADEFIARLPQGFDTFLGQKAAKLSTGQRQRLGIARALLRDTSILILDEPTAALDAETELRLIENLRDWGRDRTIFFIAHRLSTIRHADQILFLDHGRLIESGTHEELMAREGGRYREFARAQTGDVPEEEPA